MLRMRVKCDLKIRAELIKQVRSEDAVVVVSLEEDCVLLKGRVKDVSMFSLTSNRDTRTTCLEPNGNYHRKDSRRIPPRRPPFKNVKQRDKFSDITMRHSVIEWTYWHVLPGYGNASVVGTCAQEGLEVQMQMQEIIKRHLPPAMKEAYPIITYGHVAPLNEDESRNSIGDKENTTALPR